MNYIVESIYAIRGMEKPKAQFAVTNSSPIKDSKYNRFPSTSTEAALVHMGQLVHSKQLFTSSARLCSQYNYKIKEHIIKLRR